MAWANTHSSAGPEDQKTLDASSVDILNARYVVQLVKQVNFGPLESKRYFAAIPDANEKYAEVSEKELVDANFKKLNSFKNFKCNSHNKFFELNLYQKDPMNKHRWRADVARPAGEIDLVGGEGQL